MALTIFHDLFVVSAGYGRLDPAAEQTWLVATCPHCGGSQMGVVAATKDEGVVKWVRCASCLEGAVMNGGVIAPSVRPLRVPQGLPAGEAAVWDEVRECLAMGAATASVMLCRKLLLHIAVTHGLSPKSAKGWAPTFKDVVDHLEAEGLITKKMRPWVDRIKDVGNEANHELQPVSADDALDVATFTQQLLTLAFEMDALMADPESAVQSRPCDAPFAASPDQHEGQ